MSLVQKSLNILKTVMFRGGGSGRNDWWTSLLTGDKYDYKARAGNPWDNSTVANCTKAMLRMLTDAEICIQTRASKGSGGQWETDWEHPLVELLQNPNPYHDATQLLDLICLSWVFDGSAYLWKERSKAKKVTRLWWLHHDLVQPVRSTDGKQFISHYEYSVNGKIFIIPVEDIVHLKNGVDPENELKGWSDVKPQLRKICTENEAGNYTNAILHNAGIPNVVIAPEAGAVIKDPKDLGEKWTEKFSGARRGEPWVQSTPMKVTVIGFDPKSLDLSTLEQSAQASIAASFGIPAVVVGLLVGLKSSGTKANWEESLWQAYVACILPMLKRISRQLTKALVEDKFAPWGKASTVRVWFDLSEVKCLGEDMDALAKRIVLLFEAGIIKRGQAQTALNYPLDKTADEYASPKIAKPTTRDEKPVEEDENEPEADVDPADPENE